MELKEHRVVSFEKPDVDMNNEVYYMTAEEYKEYAKLNREEDIGDSDFMKNLEAL